MPFTLSHPIAVLPLTGWSFGRRNLAALVVGSLAPDAGYFVGQFGWATLGHTAAGTMWPDLPVAWLALGIFRWIRRPACRFLPEPHRSALSGCMEDETATGWRARLAEVGALLLGIVSHTAWDSCTHPGGWTIRHLPTLGTPVPLPGSGSLPLHYLLQQASSLLGLAGLAWLYWRWLGRQPIAPARNGDPRGHPPTWILPTVCALGLGIAVGLASSKPLPAGYLGVRIFVFRTAVKALALSGAGWILLASGSKASALFRHRNMKEPKR